VNPPFLIGPFAPGFCVPPGDLAALGTNRYIYNLLFENDMLFTPACGFVDVRDVAIGLVKSLNTTGRHRIIFGGEWFTLEEALIFIAKSTKRNRNQLAFTREIDPKRFHLDNSKAAHILGLTPRPWRETIQETVAYLLKLEKSWIDQRITIGADGSIKPFGTIVDEGNPE